MRKNEIFSFIGLSAIIFSILFYNKYTPTPSLYNLLPIIGSIIFILFADKKTIAARILRVKLFVGIGLISYSAYLWHQPLFAFAKIILLEEPSEFFMVNLSIISLIIGYFSWKYIEIPFRYNDRFFISKKYIFILFVFNLILFPLIGFSIIYSEIYKRRFDSLLEGDVGHLIYHQFIDEKYHDCEPQEIAQAALSWEGFLRCKQSREGEPDWILLGDSHAEHLFLGLAEAYADRNIAFYIASAKPYIEEIKFENIFRVISQFDNKKNYIINDSFYF